MRDTAEFDPKYKARLDKMVGKFIKKNKDKMKDIFIREYLLMKKRTKEEVLEMAARLAAAKRGESV